MSAPLALLELEGQSILANFRFVREREFTQWIVDYATALGWSVYHVPDSRRTVSSGFPDLILLRPPFIFFAELKTMSLASKLSVSQERWLGRLEACGLPTRVWRPKDVAEIMALLKSPCA